MEVLVLAEAPEAMNVPRIMPDWVQLAGPQRVEMAGLLVIKEMTETPEEMVRRAETESPVPRVHLVRTVRKAHR
jgi:hypothetical protein